MAAVLTPLAVRTTRYNVSWEEFERLLADNSEGHARQAYYEGTLETTVSSQAHEEPIEFLSGFIRFAAHEARIEVRGIRSTTIKRTDARKGFEPDGCYYIQNASLVRGKREIDFATAPPPDLVIEIDISRDSRIKLPLFAALRIPEVWRYDGEVVHILTLSGDEYEPSPSRAFPGLDGQTLTRFVEDGPHLDSEEWTAGVCRWARDRLRR